MVDWFKKLTAGSELPTGAASELEERGFVIIPGPVPPDRMELLAVGGISRTAATSPSFCELLVLW